MFKMKKFINFMIFTLTGANPPKDVGTGQSDPCQQFFYYQNA
jgi:hypothetical protein